MSLQKIKVYDQTNEEWVYPTLRNGVFQCACPICIDDKLHWIGTRPCACEETIFGYTASGQWDNAIYALEVNCSHMVAVAGKLLTYAASTNTNNLLKEVKIKFYVNTDVWHNYSQTTYQGVKYFVIGFDTYSPTLSGTVYTKYDQIAIAFDYTQSGKQIVLLPGWYKMGSEANSNLRAVFGDNNIVLVDDYGDVDGDSEIDITLYTDHTSDGSGFETILELNYKDKVKGWRTIQKTLGKERLKHKPTLIGSSSAFWSGGDFRDFVIPIDYFQQGSTKYLHVKCTYLTTDIKPHNES